MKNIYIIINLVVLTIFLAGMIGLFVSEKKQKQKIDATISYIKNSVSLGVLHSWEDLQKIYFEQQK